MPGMGWERIVRDAGAQEIAAASSISLSLENDPALVPLETLPGRDHYAFPPGDEPPWRWQIASLSALGLTHPGASDIPLGPKGSCASASSFDAHYANVVSTLCLFIVLGGGAYAASKLKNNSVSTAKIRNAAVTDTKLADGAVTETKISSSAQAALRAGPAGGALVGSYPNPRLAPPEAIHEVTGFGNCNSSTAWENEQIVNPNFPKVGFFRDPFGVVHLRGAVSCPGLAPGASEGIFTLPAGYRPPLAEIFSAAGEAGPTEVQVASNGLVIFQGTGANPGANGFLTLDGVTFRCEPAGVSGCP
jgi:hypothetical protein